MSGNPIPPELQTEHLFLLVGTNPLPNWVAAKVLLKPHGRVYLAYTKQTEPVARRLRDSLTPGITVDWENDCFQTDQAYDEEIFSSITERLRGLNGTVGLNYTGGTKMMSVHTHRAMREFQLDPAPVLSYLDARTLQMMFDGMGKNGYPVGGCEDVRIGVGTLLELHDYYPDGSPAVHRHAIAKEAADAIARVHQHYVGQAAWRRLPKQPHDSLWAVSDFMTQVQKEIDELGKTNRTQPPTTDALRQIEAAYSLVLLKMDMQEGESLSNLAEKNGFADHARFRKWLDGLWLEHYTLDQILRCARESALNDDGIGINLEPINADKRSFEADVIALRGYQLFYFSCYAGSTRRTAKGKLFEAAIRAAQLGGDEAMVALVCCGDKSQDENDCVDSVKREVEAEWQKAGRVRVFGRKDLPKLSEKLQKEWFNRR
jgi:hypothetical protein